MPVRNGSALRAPRALLAIAAGGLVAGAAAAQAPPRDAQAEAALNEAMRVDYLETRFDQAERKLRAAIDACGASECSPAMKARLFIALGSVLAQGRKELGDARDAFADALRIDPSAKLNPDLATPEVSFAFEQARAATGVGAPAAAGPELQIAPPAEQRIRTPVPIYVEVPAELLPGVKQVTLWYQAPGEREYRPLVMKKLRGQGFGINVPCAAASAEGTLRYHVAAVDEDGAILASAGARDAPLTTEIKARITSAPPRWPGHAPPAMCAAPEQERPRQCIDDRQCSRGLTCVRGACVARPPAEAAPSVPRSWVGLTFSPDVALFSGREVCSLASQERGNFVCLRGDGTRYDGAPTPGVANDVNLGFALATSRVALAYDRLVLDNLTVGGRVGFAAGGTTGGGASFLPLHLEARAQYFLMARPFAELGARPFVLAAAGVAQVDAEVDVEVLEDAAACGAGPAITSPCTRPGRSGRVEERQQTLAATRQAGQGFASLGAGVAYAPLEAVSLNLALRASLTFPAVTAVLSPEVGLSLGF
ncbi:MULTISPECIES: hypothetical protein [Sorangium]|uniref:Secreted protein n=1 Tax=Sorangium cellulosum TaxID=56 RepID=A0A4P2QJ67_SORCE|nr:MULTISPECIES: hypothetical protein [Sorangium]AUX29990.1 uncharacterized protein SOCE836_020850 [Sorangium cellulosum]WCQ89380.1 hypothetical protein NQZ70_02067 [Sorangium sp. Soce836]